MKALEIQRFPIGWLAAGYFVSYIPYTCLVKVLSQGALPGFAEGIPGFEMLPGVALATTCALLLYLALLRGWRLERQPGRPAGSWPRPSRHTLISGLATATIIAATTLAYTFEGISILFALLLMRGGVLILAPIVDASLGRRVAWYSWSALALSFLAIGVAFSRVEDYLLTGLAALNLAAYLGGYAVRIRTMTLQAKSGRRSADLGYFVEETAVAALALSVVPAGVALCGWGPIPEALRAGYLRLGSLEQCAPALLIGLLYAVLFVFGSSIYLKPRENSYCIPLNRASSLLSGIVASFLLGGLLAWPLPSVTQLFAAGLIVAAMVLLAVPALRRAEDDELSRLDPAQRLYLFVCAGNRSRSPMAAAVCNHLALGLGLAEQVEAVPVVALSAGLSPRPGDPMSPGASSALAALEVADAGHASRLVDARLVRRADRIFTMTQEQAEELSTRFTDAAGKVERLDPALDVPEPKAPEGYADLAQRLLELVGARLPEAGPGSRG